MKIPRTLIGSEPLEARAIPGFSQEGGFGLRYSFLFSLMLFLILQTWPFVVSGRPDSDTKEVSAASRLCGTTA